MPFTKAEVADMTRQQNRPASDVVGPAGAAANNLVAFNGVTGKVLKDSGVSAASLAASDAAVQAFAIQRANHTGTQLAATISDFAATVRATVLTGLSTASAAVVTAASTVISALGQLQAQISALAAANTGTNTGDQTITLTGPITGSGTGTFATSVAAQTGTGTTFVMDTSPTLVGTPLAPTAAAATNTTQIATTAFVQAAVSAAVAGLLNFKGTTDCSANPNYPSASKGDAYIVSVAGKIGGASGASVEIGDWYVATATNAGGTEAAVGTSWGHMEHNLVGALLSSNNLSDVANAGTARGNLGLGTAATATASALSKTDDTNVTLTLGGTIATALLQAVSLTLGWTGLLASSRGGTGNGFTKFSGPATAEKTFTLPNASATILTDNAAVTVAQGGTGRATSTTAYGLIAAGTTATGAHQTLAAGATTEILVGGGASALPAWTTATGSGSPVRATSPTLTTPIIAATAFASLPSAASNSGSLAYATDLGASGTLVRSDGTRWRPVNGRTLLKLSSLGSAIGSTETIVLQTQIPAGVLVAGDVLSITFAATKSGTTDSTNWSVRMGTAGTTADALQTTGNAALMTAAQINGNGLAEFLIASATTTQRLGAQSGTGYFGAATGNATQAAQAVSNISNSLYVSLSVVSTGATNTTTLQAGRIELLTP